MARIYVGQVHNVTVSALQDLWAIIATTTPKSVRLLRCVISCTDTAIPTSQMFGIQIKVFSGATITAGTGGTTPAVQKTDNGDAASSGFTLAANNATTQATTTGTTNVVYDGGFHAYNGFDESFFADGSNPRGALPIMVQSAVNAGSIIVGLTSTAVPSGTVHFSSTVWVEEAG